MFRLIWIIGIYIRSFMRRFMPTNIAIDATRTRRGLKWGAPLMVLAIPYLYVGSIMTTLIDGGASKWLYLVALVCIWNALKFIINGPITLALLARTRVEEHRAVRYAQRATGPLVEAMH
ncbi:MAG: sulfate permease [Cryobacterium sp.]|nr:sulfate permease [Cryobacterium sp.]